jgi:hypothetical protein
VIAARPAELFRSLAALEALQAPDETSRRCSIRPAREPNEFENA